MNQHNMMNNNEKFIADIKLIYEENTSLMEFK